MARDALGLRQVGYSRAIHIFTAPVSAKTMRTPQGAPGVGHDPLGFEGEVSSAAPRASSSASSARIFLPLAPGCHRRAVAAARASRVALMSAWTPTSTS